MPDVAVRSGAETARVLVIEDELGIVDFLARGLRAPGFEVVSAQDGVEGAARALHENFDLVVLGMMLPGRSGLDVLAELHASKPELPVIVLTARGEIDDRVAGLDAGAVDYLVKPFALRELAARIRAQLRTAGSQGSSTVLKGGDLSVDLLAREVRRGDEVVSLSQTEYELLVYLLRNRGRVLTRTQIQRAVWGYQHDPGTNVVDVYVGYLRRKLRAVEPTEGSGSSKIVTLRSVGYRLDVSD